MELEGRKNSKNTGSSVFDVAIRYEANVMFCFSKIRKEQTSFLSHIYVTCCIPVNSKETILVSFKHTGSGISCLQVKENDTCFICVKNQHLKVVCSGDSWVVAFTWLYYGSK